jgi:hypothetical protein
MRRPVVILMSSDTAACPFTLSNIYHLSLVLGTMAVRLDVGSRSRGKYRYLESTCVSGLPFHHGLVLRPNRVLENVGGKSERHKYEGNSISKLQIQVATYIF